MLKKEKSKDSKKEEAKPKTKPAKAAPKTALKTKPAKAASAKAKLKKPSVAKRKETAVHKASESNKPVLAREAVHNAPPAAHPAAPAAKEAVHKTVTEKPVVHHPAHKTESAAPKPASVPAAPVASPAPKPGPAAVSKPAVAPAAPKPAPLPQAAPKPVIAVKPAAPAKPIQVQPPVPKIEAAAPAAELKECEVELPVTVKDLSVKLQQKPSLLIKVLMDMRVMAGINQILDETLAAKVCEKFGCRIKKAPGKEELILRQHEAPDRPEDLKSRPPIVTFMGHVDHGKTSLLDAIRKSKVAETEHGGITQHIGAYRVVLPHGEITFLDTPGHEAFTAMRARGAKATDIVVLVVAADDGVMPQTREAIDHARAAGVGIIVAVNKIDKPQANPDRVKKQLSELGLTPEDWGGKTITVGVSAKTGEGIDNLLEMILLESQMLELKANPSKEAKGVVLEAKISKGRGPVATLLVQDGTLKLNHHIIVGSFYGKIRAMFDYRGHAVISAPPSFPVEVLGLTGVPEAGDQFYGIGDEKTAKELAQARQEKERQRDMKQVKRVSLEDLHAQIQEGKLKELNLILKSDVQGSLEAIKDTITKLDVSEIKINIIHEGVGNINNSDVILAMASDALILGFHVEADDLAKEMVAKEGVEVRTYNIIYELADDIKAAVEGMLEPKLKKVFLGRAEVRKVFKLSRSGTIAGCFVTKGSISRSATVSLVRNGQPMFEGSLGSLKRFKDDVREVAEGFECGIAINGFDSYQEGDIIEAFTVEKIARKL